ncbi:hypothetical protein M9458_018151, partial [Cirrhinus mrigala]
GAKYRAGGSRERPGAPYCLNAGSCTLKRAETTPGYRMCTWSLMAHFHRAVWVGTVR